MALQSFVADARPIAAAKPAPIRFGRAWSIALLANDVTMFSLATGAAAYLVEHGRHVTLDANRVALTAAACSAAWLLLFYRVGLYRRSFAGSMRDEFYCAVTALTLGAAPLLLLFTIVPAISSSRVVLLLSLAFAIVTVGLSRAAAREAHSTFVRRRPRRMALVGSRASIDAALSRLLVDGSPILRLEVDDLEASLADVDPLSLPAIDAVPWLKQARDWACDMLLLTEMPPPQALPAMLRTAALERFTIAFAPPQLYAQAYDLRLETNGHQALIVPRQLYAVTHGPRILKRAVDVVIAATVLVLALPILVLAALAIRLEDGGPIFFRQERVGLFGRSFDVLKFRSMRVNAEQHSGPIWSPVRDDRTTRVGRFIRRTSIDELPQLINVLRGDMSIVGPRPERPAFVERFRQELPRYDERHLVRPGITGWAQVNMERKLDQSQVGEKLSFDLWYVEHWGLFMDFSIIMKTAAEFLFHRA